MKPPLGLRFFIEFSSSFQDNETYNESCIKIQNFLAILGLID